MLVRVADEDVAPQHGDARDVADEARVAVRLGPLDRGDLPRGLRREDVVRVPSGATVGNVFKQCVSVLKHVFYSFV